MKRLLSTLLIALSLALCGSVVFADDGSNNEVLPENNQATSQAFQSAFAAEHETLNQSMILATADTPGDLHDLWPRWRWWRKFFCTKYDRRCCDASPVRKEKWCKRNARKATRYGCSCE